MKLATRPVNNTSLIAGEDFYQRLNSVHDTIISLQYNVDEFLSFHVSQAKQGNIVNGTEFISLCCQIGEKVYTFNCEHFNQMSNSECNDLFNHLGLDSSQLSKK
jgi:hypothetical protein